MNTFITRWTTALSVTAAAAIVLTAGAVRASDQSPRPLDSSQAPATALALASEQIDTLPIDESTLPGSACPLEPVGAYDVPVAGVGIDVSSSRPTDTGVASPVDHTLPGSDGIDLGVDAGTDPASDGAGDGIDVTLGSSGLGADQPAGTSDDTGAGGQPADQPADEPGTAPPAGPDAGTPDDGAADDGGDVATGDPTANSSRRYQLIDLDAATGVTAAALDVPASDGTLVQLGLGEPAADDPSTVSFIDVGADAQHVDATDADVAGIDVIDGAAAGAAPDAGLVLPTAGTADGTGTGASTGTLADVDHTGDIVTVGDVGTTGSAPLVLIVAPVTA